MPEQLTDRVRKLIDSSALTQAEFAQAIGIDGPKLTKSLTGKRRFSSSELASIADITRVTVDWLLTGSERSRVLTYRAVESTLECGDQIGREKIDIIDDRVDGLVFLGQPLRIPTLPQPVQAPLMMTQGAETAPRYSDVLDERIRDLSTNELIDRIEDRFGVHTVVTRLPAQFDGLSYSRDGLRIIVLATSAIAPFRQRFTLAHELGHIAFHDSPEDVIQERLYEVKTFEETRANSFAAAFLAPREELMEIIGKRKPAKAFDDLVLAFQMSPGSMAFRLRNENLIGPDEVQHLAEPSAKAIALRAGKASDYVEHVNQSSQERPPRKLVAAYLDAYTKGKTTLGPIANLLDRPLKEVEQTYGDMALSEGPDLNVDTQ
jgi:Zn-dependent peptidase ImmA (M78 family)/predicted XRE-type DNA-binding protein